jgi:hypothetical protein
LTGLSYVRFKVDVIIVVFSGTTRYDRYYEALIENKREGVCRNGLLGHSGVPG